MIKKMKNCFTNNQILSVALGKCDTYLYVKA